MIMMMMLRVLVLLFLPLSVYSTALQVVNGSPSCSGDLTLDSFGVDCGNECNFGRQIKVYGQVSLSNDLSDSQVHVKATACLMSIICITLLETDGSICDELESLEGQTCPAAGLYQFQSKFRLPGDDDQDWFHGYWIDVKTKVTTSTGSTTSCSLTVKAVQSSYQMAYLMASFCGIALVTGLATVLRSKRRALVNLDEFEDDDVNTTTADFEMMQDAPRSREQGVVA